jgi:hypothetical protein
MDPRGIGGACIIRQQSHYSVGAYQPPISVV